MSIRAAPFSNYGDENVDVFAPGQSIYSTTPGDAYGRNDGTSMAAPIVYGLSTLLMAYYPDLSARQVRDIILETAIPYRDVQVTPPGNSDQTVAFGELPRTGTIINAPAALRRAAEQSSVGALSQ
jgi:subtilisin family serine protease